ncbi:MAG: inositol monophosphatase family protein [Balneolaceae bacterium]|nr:inositol monophosphatase family protein [Balneolaceae bacterium]
MKDYSEELELARQIARDAAELVRNYTLDRNFDVEFKGKNDLVTDADLETENLILEKLSEAFPDDQILAEETSKNHILPEERTWMIDPIDGTTNFAHGFPVFCVSIALWEEQEAKIGVVLEVNKEELFHAVKGEGAYLNDRPISVSSVEDPQYAMIGTGFPYNDLSLIKNYVRFFEWLLYRTQGIRRPGAASYDLCCVAAGRFDGFYEYSLNPWDVGAASIIVREAGGVITDWMGGNNWLFGQRIVAGNSHIQQFLVDAIQEHFPKEELRM